MPFISGTNSKSLFAGNVFVNWILTGAIKYAGTVVSLLNFALMPAKAWRLPVVRVRFQTTPDRVSERVLAADKEGFHVLTSQLLILRTHLVFHYLLPSNFHLPHSPWLQCSKQTRKTTPLIALRARCHQCSGTRKSVNLLTYIHFH